MTAIETAITNIWPETEAYLISKYPTRYADQKATEIAVAITRLYRSISTDLIIPAQADITDVLTVKYIAAIAVLGMIPTAKDAYIDASYSINETNGDSGSTTTTLESKLRVMDNLATNLRADAASLLTLVTTALTPPPEPPATTNASIPALCEVGPLPAWFGQRGSRGRY